MTRLELAALAALGLSLSACGGGGEAAGNEAGDLPPGQSVDTANGINVTDDASGTTGSSTGDAGGTLNIAGDAAGDSTEANAASNGH